MTIYILLFVYCLFSGLIFFNVNNRASTQLYVIVSALLLGLFSGLRYHTGWDWEAYDYFIEHLPGILSGDIWSNNVFGYEPLFVIIVSILNEIGLSAYLFFSISTIFLTTFSAHRYLGKYISIFFIVYLFYGYFQNFSIVRQGIAAAIFLFSIRYIEQKKFYQYLIGILVASLFHISSLLLLPIYYIVIKLRMSRTAIFVYITATVIFVAFPVLSYLNDLTHVFSIFGDKVNEYVSNKDLTYKTGFSFKYLELLLLVLIYQSNKFFNIGLSTFGKYYNIFGMIVVLQLGVYSFLNDFSIIFERISSFFEVSQGIFIIMNIALLKGNVSKSLIIVVLAVLIFVRYERLFYHSNNYIRLGNDMGHLERFENYCSVLNKKECGR
nr:O-antigen polymerase [Vibrio fluvialis]